MTLQEICVFTLKQLNEDEDALDELREQLYADINDGLYELYLMYPVWQKKFTLDSNSSIVIDELISGTARLIKLKTLAGTQLFWQEAGGKVFVLKETNWEIDRGVKGSDVIATLRSLPARLSSTSDVPDIPEQFHRALADYATFRMLGTGTIARQNRGSHFLERFLNAKKMLASWVNNRSRIANKFS